MPRKRDKPEEIVANRQVDVLVSQGQSVADAVRSIGVTEVTYYRWRQEFGGLKGDHTNVLCDAVELVAEPAAGGETDNPAYGRADRADDDHARDHRRGEERHRRICDHDAETRACSDVFGGDDRDPTDRRRSFGAARDPRCGSPQVHLQG